MRGFTQAEILSAIPAINTRWLIYLDEAGFAKASVARPSGPGSRRQWSSRDVAKVAILAALKQTGLSMPRAAKAADLALQLAQERGGEFQSITVFDGRDVQVASHPAGPPFVELGDVTFEGKGNRAESRVEDASVVVQVRVHEILGRVSRGLGFDLARELLPPRTRKSRQTVLEAPLRLTKGGLS